MHILDILPTLDAQSVTPLASQSETPTMDTNFDTKAGPLNTPHQQTTPHWEFPNLMWGPLMGLYILGVGQDL